MNRGSRTDWLMASVAVAPAALAFGGHPGPALLLFVPLLLAACLHGLWEAVESRTPRLGPSA